MGQTSLKRRRRNRSKACTLTKQQFSSNFIHSHLQRQAVPLEWGIKSFSITCRWYGAVPFHYHQQSCDAQGNSFWKFLLARPFLQVEQVVAWSKMDRGRTSWGKLVSGTITLLWHTSKEGGCKEAGLVCGVTSWGWTAEKQQPIFESSVGDRLLTMIRSNRQ